jgi:hypothetical protein
MIHLKSSAMSAGKRLLWRFVLSANQRVRDGCVNHVQGNMDVMERCGYQWQIPPEQVFAVTRGRL